MVMCCPLCKGMIHPIGNGALWQCEDCKWSGPYPRFRHDIEKLCSKMVPLCSLCGTKLYHSDITGVSMLSCDKCMRSIEVSKQHQ